MPTLQAIGLFIFICGFIIGLGAVTVIDIHGFLGRKSSYWTRATISAHKVTKPLIWAGTILAGIGGALFYSSESFTLIPQVHAAVFVLLIANGCFLSFVVSPFLLARERKGRERELLPQSFQNKIAASLIVSDIGWWGSVVLLVVYLSGM